MQVRLQQLRLVPLVTVNSDLTRNFNLRTWPTYCQCEQTCQI